MHFLVDLRIIKAWLDGYCVLSETLVEERNYGCRGWEILPYGKCIGHFSIDFPLEFAILIEPIGTLQHFRTDSSALFSIFVLQFTTFYK